MCVLGKVLHVSWLPSKNWEYYTCMYNTVDTDECKTVIMFVAVIIKHVI